MHISWLWQLSKRLCSEDFAVRFYSSATTPFAKQLLTHEINTCTNAVVKPVKTFVNRNNRSLERLALAHKDIGWGRGHSRVATNLPKREYYHRVCLERTSKHTYAWLEHYNGHKVVEASTKDWRIRKQLFKSTDVSACVYVASILMEKCIRAGFSCAEWLPPEGLESDAITEFCNIIKESGFVLQEPSQIPFRRKPPHYVSTGPSPPKIA